MTRIDRYILVLFLRTVAVCFCSLAGIFIVFHAFTSMDELAAQGHREGGLIRVMMRIYGPYMLLLFDWTGSIIAMMALLFTVGWLRRTGELTATLSVGISHGRILRPMILASLALVCVQCFNREWLLPQHRDALSMKAKEFGEDSAQPVLPSYDRTSGILFEGVSLIAKQHLIYQPNLRIYGEFAGFGDLLLADSAQWTEADANHASGYLLTNVKRPEKIDQLRSVGTAERLILMTSADQPWLSSRQCFVATTIHSDLLQTNQSAKRIASIPELIDQVQNPAVHSAASVHVLLHERILRPPLDFALVLLGLPLVINRSGRNMFVMIGYAIGTVLAFFLIKTVAGAMGGSGYLISPSTAAWIPIVILGPIAYMRLREIETI